MKLVEIVIDLVLHLVVFGVGFELVLRAVGERLGVTN